MSSAPFNARLNQDKAGSATLFERREFRTPADSNSIILPTSAYCKQIRRARDTIDICSFIEDLRFMHAWEDEIKLVVDEEKARNDIENIQDKGREDDPIHSTVRLRIVDVWEYLRSQGDNNRQDFPQDRQMGRSHLPHGV
mmetsp:Transcript_27218/g.58484  ORF Transcript_27218/g.58484 Transcript_27218/m.58484 type:complete len:140 (+) Transcript_27218:628-1047(+)